jgi:hypothetical protein
MLKIEQHPNSESARFCSLIVVQGPTGNNEMLPDVKKLLRKMFCMPAQFIGATKRAQYSQMRSVALSYKMMYPNAPVLGPLCDHILDLTRGYQNNLSVDITKYHALTVTVDETVFRQPADVSASSRFKLEEYGGISLLQQGLLEAAIAAASSRKDPRVLVDRTCFGIASGFDAEYVDQYVVNGASLPPPPVPAQLRALYVGSPLPKVKRPFIDLIDHQMRELFAQRSEGRGEEHGMVQ